MSEITKIEYLISQLDYIYEFLSKAKNPLPKQEYSDRLKEAGQLIKNHSSLNQFELWGNHLISESESIMDCKTLLEISERANDSILKLGAFITGLKNGQSIR